ncbi:MAG: hypothetical protein JNK87_20150 [Bryobacterales bacterium]|nr:hypothetical protein [Bryobacterales bacterium]
MLELLISELLRGQGAATSRDAQSLLRLLGPLASALLPTGEPGLSTGLSSSGRPASVLQMVSGAGGFLGLPSLVQALFGRRQQVPVAAPPLRLPRYEAPAAYNEEYGVASRTGTQVVARQDEFGRSEVRRRQEGGSEVSVTTTASQTLDGRVLLQYSDEIAQAVRQALLYSHPLSELISE